MINAVFKKLEGKRKFLIMAILLAITCFLAYYFHLILGVRIVFTHLFYVPIILAALWWKRKGIGVAVFLSAFLMLTHFFERGALTVDVCLRSSAFIIVAFIAAILSERIEGTNDKATQAYSDLDRIFNTAGNGMRVIDKNFTMLQVNDRFAALAGLDKDEMPGKKCYETLFCALCHTDDCPLVRALRGAEWVECDVEKVRHNGDRISCILTATPLLGSGKDVVGIVEDIKDITGRKQAEKSLLTEKEKAQRYLDVAGVMLVAIDSDQNVSLINKKGCEVLGYNETEIIGKNWFDNFLSEGIRDQEKGIFEKLMAGKIEPVKYFENSVLTKSGEERIIECHNTVLTDEAGNITGAFGSGEDITDRKRIEEQFQQAQKMEAIGRLAGGIAHDFNNLLQAVIGNSDFVLYKYGEQEALCKDIEEIKDAGKKAASLARQLLVFSRKQAVQLEVLDLNAVVSDTEKMLRRLIGEDIELVMSLDPGLKSVKADKGNIGQVIMNLAVNARDAMTEGGRITIRTENVVLDKTNSAEIQDERSGEFACLSVKDTGTGIDRAIIDKIFDPFFTTKKEVEGTGLGLSTIYGITKQHSGWIDVYSESGEGTEFKVYLPCSSAEAEVDIKEEMSLKEFQGNGERILVIEDEPDVLQFVIKALQGNGYTVFGASSAKEAMDVFKREKGEFDLVLSDVVLSDGKGHRLVEQLKSHNSEFNVLFTSGYAEDRSECSTLTDNGFNFIQKPYELIDLLKTVRYALKDAPEPALSAN